MRKDSTEEANTTAPMPPELAAGIARVEALLRVALRRQLANAIPGSWLKGRKQKILELCSAPRTRQEIREHLGGIAGYEMRQFLDEAVSLGLLARSAIAANERFETVLRPLKASKRRKTRRTRKRGSRN